MPENSGFLILVAALNISIERSVAIIVDCGNVFRILKGRSQVPEAISRITACVFNRGIQEIRCCFQC